jgi:hypothetical protein
MEPPRWSLHDGASTMEPPRWSLHDGAYTMEPPRWSLHDGASTMEPPRWSLHDGAYTMEPPRWSLHDGAYTMEPPEPARAGQSRPEPAMGDTAAGQSPPEPARARQSRPEPTTAGARAVCSRGRMDPPQRARALRAAARCRSEWWAHRGGPCRRLYIRQEPCSTPQRPQWKQEDSAAPHWSRNHLVAKFAKSLGCLDGRGNRLVV